MFSSVEDWDDTELVRLFDDTVKEYRECLPSSVPPNSVAEAPAISSTWTAVDSNSEWKPEEVAQAGKTTFVLPVHEYIRSPVFLWQIQQLNQAQAVLERLQNAWLSYLGPGHKVVHLTSPSPFEKKAISSFAFTSSGECLFTLDGGETRVGLQDIYPWPALITEFAVGDLCSVFVDNAKKPAILLHYPHTEPSDIYEYLFARVLVLDGDKIYFHTCMTSCVGLFESDEPLHNSPLFVPQPLTIPLEQMKALAASSDWIHDNPVAQMYHQCYTQPLLAYRDQLLSHFLAEILPKTKP